MLKYKGEIKKVVDSPYENYPTFDEIHELAETMGADVIEYPDKTTETAYALPWKGIVRYPPNEKDSESVKRFVLLHELGHVRKGHGFGRATPAGAMLEELEATNWAYSTKCGIPLEEWVVGMLASIAQDVGFGEFKLSKRETWSAARDAAREFGINKTLIREAEKTYWKRVGSDDYEY